MKIGEISILFTCILLQHMCLSQKLLFKQSPASFLELQKSNQKEGLLPLKHMHSQQNVIKTSKRSGMLCRSVCGKCERVLGQSWSLMPTRLLTLGNTFSCVLNSNVLQRSQIEWSANLYWKKNPHKLYSKLCKEVTAF